MSLMNPNVANSLIGPIDRNASNPVISFGADQPNSSGTGMRGDFLSISLSIAGIDKLVLNGDSLSMSGMLIASEGLGVGNSVEADTLGDVVASIEVFDEDGESLGFLPVYDSIS